MRNQGTVFFKFSSMWWREPSLEGKLRTWWIESDIYEGTISYCFMKRLNFLKQKLRTWNKEVFKNNFVEEKVEEN